MCRGHARQSAVTHVQVVENILDDDQDMEDMNLGRRAENEEKMLAVSVKPHAPGSAAHQPRAGPTSSLQSCSLTTQLQAMQCRAD